MVIVTVGQYHPLLLTIFTLCLGGLRNKMSVPDVSSSDSWRGPGLFLTVAFSPPSWDDACEKWLIFSDSLFSKPGKITKAGTRRIMTLHETVSSMEFNKALMLSESKANPGLEEEVGWHQATMWGARLPRKAGWGLCPRSGQEGK